MPHPGPAGVHVSLAKSAEAINVVFGFVIAAGFDKQIDQHPGVVGWCMFIIGLTFVARFTLGAANHLSYEYSENDAVKGLLAHATMPNARVLLRSLLLQDFVFLIAYGIMARLAGATPNLVVSFAWIAVLCADAVAWQALTGPTRAPFAPWTSGIDWSFWRLWNHWSVAAAVLAGAAASLVPAGRLAFVAVPAALAFFVLMVLDVRDQIGHIASYRAPAPAPAADAAALPPRAWFVAAVMVPIVVVLAAIVLFGWFWRLPEPAP
jgi:hypothetical protein